MWGQILAVAWAQFRITRNHLPRTDLGTVLSWLLLSLWYGMFVALAVFTAISLAGVGLPVLRLWLPLGLLVVFLYWQTIPLLTLSSGNSLQLNKIQVYPIRHDALFMIEVILRITGAPEAIVILLGALVGLLRHPGIPVYAPFCLLLFIPLNLFLQLAIRDFVSYAFDRSRFRELLTVLVVCVALLPQILIRTNSLPKVKPYFLFVARGAGTPWHEVAALSLGSFSPADIAFLGCWTILALFWARRQFQRGLSKDDTFRGLGAPAVALRKSRATALFESLPNRLFSDPLGALVQKELQSLVRMPRFRVLFGMACILGALVFVPIALGNRGSFMGDNFLPVVNIYGLLLLSDALLLNVFGLDRAAAELFFAAPVSFAAVLMAKNLTAALFVGLQTLMVLAIALLVRLPLSGFSIADGFAASAAVTVFLLSAGNLLSVTMPRPIDPSATFKKQAGAKMQLWLLLCSLGMVVIVGFAFLARYAFQTEWALLGVLLLELTIGLIVYRIALDSAVERGLKNREKIVAALTKGASPLSGSQGLG